MATKEELQKLNTRLEQSNEHYAKEDKRLRAEFAKAFGKYQINYEITRKREGEYISWEEIFTEVGKLLTHWQFHHTDNELRMLRKDLNAMMKQYPLQGSASPSAEDDEFDS